MGKPVRHIVTRDYFKGCECLICAPCESKLVRMPQGTTTGWVMEQRKFLEVHPPDDRCIHCGGVGRVPYVPNPHTGLRPSPDKWNRCQLCNHKHASRCPVCRYFGIRWQYIGPVTVTRHVMGIGSRWSSTGLYACPMCRSVLTEER